MHLSGKMLHPLWFLVEKNRKYFTKHNIFINFILNCGCMLQHNIRQKKMIIKERNHSCYDALNPQA